MSQLKLESFKEKTAIGLSSSSPHPGSIKREVKHEFLWLHSVPLSYLSPPQLRTGLSISHTAAPGSGWIQLSSSNIAALLRLRKETRGPHHPLHLKKVGKHNSPLSAAGELKQEGCQGTDVRGEQFR